MSEKFEHDTAASRFEIYFDDELAGYAEYVEAAGVRDFHHTVTYPQFRGHGLAGKLITFALDDTREQGLKVIPSCSFVERFISDHPGYKALV